MRERRVFITLALILGVLTVGMAYAAIGAQTLNVTGDITATTSDANFDVKFIGDVTSSGDGTVNGYIDTSDTTGRTAVINVSELTTKGQKATACINIINNSADVNAIPSISNVMHANTTWFKVDAELGETTWWNSSTQEPILLPGETVPLYITVELLDTPATDADVNAAVDTMTIKVNAEATNVIPDEYGSGGSGGTGGGTDDVELLSFEVDGVTYYAPTTYTWQQFVDDERYNTDGWVVSDGLVYKDGTLQNVLDAFAELSGATMCNTVNPAEMISQTLLFEGHLEEGRNCYFDWGLSNGAPF